MTVQRLGQPREPRAAVDGAPHHRRQPPAGRQHPGHLDQGGRPVRDVLQPELAADHLEAPVLGRQAAGVGLHPAGRRPLDRQAGRHRQHARVEVQADHLPVRADPFGGQPGHHPRAAGHVQHPLAPGRGREVQDPRRPRPEDRRDELALVDLGGATRHLPALVAHSAASIRVSPGRPGSRGRAGGGGRGCRRTGWRAGAGPCGAWRRRCSWGRPRWPPGPRRPG
jgi:hypothetical protein